MGINIIKEETPLPLPMASPFSVDGQEFRSLRFPEGKGPNLAQAMEIERDFLRRGYEMLDLEDSRRIVSRDELIQAFTGVLYRPGDLAYFRDPKSETGFWGAFLIKGRYGWGLGMSGGRPSTVSSVMILKKSSEEAIVRKVATDARRA